MLRRLFEQSPFLGSGESSPLKPFPKEAVLKTIANVIESIPKPPFIASAFTSSSASSSEPSFSASPLIASIDGIRSTFDPSKPPFQFFHQNSLRLMTGLVEKLLNQQIYSPAALKPARARLIGKSITFDIRELKQPFTVVFSESALDILMTADYSADCQLTTDFETLKRLQDKQQLTDLIKSESMCVVGDLDVLQRFAYLIEQMDKSISTVLSPIIGDIPSIIIEKQINIFIKILIKAKSIVSNRNY